MVNPEHVPTGFREFFEFKMAWYRIEWGGFFGEFSEPGREEPTIARHDQSRLAAGLREPWRLVDRINLLCLDLSEVDTKFACAIGEPMSGVLGPDDAGIAVLERNLSQVSALLLRRIPEDDCPMCFLSRVLDGRAMSDFDGTLSGSTK